MMRTVVLGLVVCWGARAQKWTVVDSIAQEYQQCLRQTTDKVGCAKDYFWALKDVDRQLYGTLYNKVDSVQRKQLAAEFQVWDWESNTYYAKQFKAFKTAYPQSNMTQPDRKSAPLAEKLFLDFATLVRKRIASLKATYCTP
jgi:hypothetical protein